MPSRRAMLLSPLAVVAARDVMAASGKMTLAIHQNTSSGAGYRKSLEGWARAGIKNVEITAALLDEFLKTDSLPAARRVLTDLGLTPVSCACGVGGLWEPNPNHAAALENLKKRCEMFAALGPEPHLCAHGHDAEIHAGRLQDRRRQHARRRGGRQTVPHDGDGRIRAHLVVHLDAADAAQDDARRGPSEHRGRCSIAITSGPASTSSRTSI